MSTIPLAERMRPKNTADYIGQSHLIGENGALSSAIHTGKLFSCLFWGPPGIGKTTLAHLIATQCKREFHSMSAIHAGVKELRDIISIAEKLKAMHSPAPIVFIDEIHRFNKSQQDALLGPVESGLIALIGATTENPRFALNPALLSRCQVYSLKELSDEELIILLKRTIAHDDYLRSLPIELLATDAILMLAGGDGRKLLNLLELIVNTLVETNKDHISITNEIVLKIAQEKIGSYDKNGNNHYNVISAFIKSLRGNDPNAGLYWLFRMIEAGEDPLFIARRMIIFAAEDIGNANPTALILANNCYQSVNVIGYPEARYILAQTTIYLAASPKSRSAAEAMAFAQDFIRHNQDYTVPLHLTNNPTSTSLKFENPVRNEFLPNAIAGTKFYTPAGNAREQEMRKFLKDKWEDKYGY